jgi:hypothetical protein
MWTPLVRRSSGRSIGISNRRITSSVHAPAASTTARALTIEVSPVMRSRIATPVIRPFGPRSRRVTSVYVRQSAPRLRASIAFSRTRRASSVAQS